MLLNALNLLGDTSYYIGTLLGVIGFEKTVKGVVKLGLYLYIHK